MDSIFRRRSGVYFARLVVPIRLRPWLNKTELIASTGVSDLALAKIVGSEILAGWRRRLLELDGVLAPMDLVQLSLGSPALSVNDGFLSLRDAASACGLDVEGLLSAAGRRRLHLYVEPAQLPGFVVAASDLDWDGQSGGYAVPTASQMPDTAIAQDRPGTLRVRQGDNKQVEEELIQGRDCRLMLFELPGRRDAFFAPSGGFAVTMETVRLLPAEVEALRRALAARVTPQQLEEARKARDAGLAARGSPKRVSEAVDAYMADRARNCSPDQARRIRAACELFVELAGNPRLCDIDRPMLRKYMERQLPGVPANENKIRLQHGTSTISQSIEAVAGTEWPTISEGERAKRMQWLCGLFTWLHHEKWISDDPAIGLARTIRPRKKAAAHRKRDQFTREELRTIFSAQWFRDGRGTMTRAGTYREFQPYYYWLLALGLYTGARINELCQLSLSDVRQTASGVWFIDINEQDDEEDDQGNKRKVKNEPSVRAVPVHPHLLRLGFDHWCKRLKAEGYDRLFPELRHDKVKGYSKDAVKWCSRYFKTLGWPRNGKKVFHSFRHTLSSECLNALGLSEAVTAQISGHERGQSVLSRTYRKDIAVDELLESVKRLDFGLPSIAAFDLDEGVKALEDALGRKRAGSMETR